MQRDNKANVIFTLHSQIYRFGVEVAADDGTKEGYNSRYNLSFAAQRRVQVDRKNSFSAYGCGSAVVIGSRRAYPALKHSREKGINTHKKMTIHLPVFVSLLSLKIVSVSVTNRTTACRSDLESER